LAEISAISSVARAKVKSAITNNTNLLVQPDLADVSSLVLNDSLVMPTKTLPNEKGAPRVQGMVNGSSCQLILDSGCTSFVISLDFT
jgi:hypothetical protein